MRKPTIITNNHFRHLKYGDEVPEKVKKEFDHLTDGEDLDGWIYYRKTWYHISDFMVMGNGHHFGEGWDGYKSDSFFSDILIKYSEDLESVKMGTYL